MVYRVEEKLGRAFAELEQYALFPLADYFSGTVRRGPKAQPTMAMSLARGWDDELRLSA
jgi:hypothetical protein